MDEYIHIENLRNEIDRVLQIFFMTQELVEFDFIEEEMELALKKLEGAKKNIEKAQLKIKKQKFTKLLTTKS